MLVTSKITEFTDTGSSYLAVVPNTKVKTRTEKGLATENRLGPMVQSTKGNS